MRQKGESASLAERLNNALAQQHAQKLAFDNERNELLAQLERVREEAERLRGKNRELRRGREEETGPRNDPEGEQVVLKIQQYLARVQESGRQMAQVASECRVFDAQIERAAALIERNIMKTSSGLLKYTQELVRQWCQRQTLRLENERLEAENRHLFELTTKLQQNFKETDRYLKQLTRSDPREDKYSQELRGRINRLEDDRTGQRREAVGQLQEKIQRLGEKVRNLQQENATIKNIHQRTMKKLEKLEEKNREQEGSERVGGGGEGLEEERRRWLQKSEEMHEEVRRLTKELLLAQESEGKAKEELAGCVEIYGQWELEREERRIEIDKLRVAIETYLEKIDQLQRAVGEARGQAEAMGERLQVSEGEKEKIVSVYQLEVQELNDLLYKKQDALAEMDAIIGREHSRLEELKKQHTELTKYAQNLQDNHKKAVVQADDLRQVLREQEQVEIKLKDTIFQAEEATRLLRQAFEKERADMLAAVEREKRQKQEMVQIMSEYKDEYYSAKKEMVKVQEDFQALQDEQFSVKQELRSILATNDDSVDVWTLLASIRDHLRAIASENKSLKQAQRELLIESQRKESEANVQLEEATQLYEGLKQYTEDEKRNEEFSLRIWKMKAIEREICNQRTLSSVNTLKELVEIVVGAAKRDNSLPEDQQSHPEVQQLREQIQQLREQILNLQNNERKLKEQVREAVSRAYKADEELNLLRELAKDSEETCKRLEEDLSLAMQEIAEERQLGKRLTEQNQTLKFERHTNNMEMNALAGELSKIQNQVDDYQDQKANIQSKLQNARKVFLKNEELEERVQQLEATIQLLEANIEHLKQQLAGKQEKESQIQDNSNLLSVKEQQCVKANAQQQQLLSQINALLQQNSELHGEISVKAGRIDELEHSLLLMNQNHQLQVAKIDTLQLQLQRRENELEEYRHICLQLEQERAVFAAVRKELQRKEEEAQKQHLQNGSQYIQLTLENEASMQQIEQLEERIVGLNAQIGEKDQKIVSLQASLDSITKAKLSDQQAIIHHNKTEPQADLKAREEELRISLTKIHEKEAELHRQCREVHQKHQEVMARQEKVKQQERQYLQKVEEMNERERQFHLQEVALLKREEQLRVSEKQMNLPEESLLGMESLRQSKNNFSSEDEALKQQLKEELNSTKRVMRQKDSALKAKESMIEDLLQRQKEDHTKLGHFQREVAQLQEELSEYREHSQHLKSSLLEVTQEKHHFEEQSEQLIREKQLLQENLSHVSQLLQQSSLKSEHLTEKVEICTTKHNKVIEELQGQLNSKQLVIIDYEKALKQQEAAVCQLTSLLAQRQQQIHLQQQELDDKQRKYSEVVSQANSMKVQNQALLRQLGQMQSKCAQMEVEVATAKKQNLQYAGRLNEIEDIMDAVRKEQAESEILREKLQETLVEKQRLEETVAGMEHTFAFSTSNIAVFEKRNKDLSDELSTLRQQLEVARLNCDKSVKEADKWKENAASLRESLGKYEKLGNYGQIGIRLENYATMLKSSDENKQKIMQQQKNISQLKIKLQDLQREISKKDDEISNKTTTSMKLQEECRQMKDLLRKNGNLDQENERLLTKNNQLKQDLEQYREELLEREAKISELKQSHAKELAQRELLQSQLKDKTIECQDLQQEAEHYRQEVKRIGKEKAQAKSEAIKSKFSLEQQQNALKIKETQLMRNSSEKEEAIRQLKQEIDSLKEHNSILQQQSQLESVNRVSKRSFTMGNPGFEIDLPLQVPLRSRQTSVQGQQKAENNTEEEEGRFFKGESRGDKVSTRLWETEKNNASLSSEVEALRGELRGRQASMDSLQRQFKSKAEDYSKLQRIVESLRDELSLERKRVKNFEDLYQSIQQKRIRIANTKLE